MDELHFKRLSVRNWQETDPYLRHFRRFSIKDGTSLQQTGDDWARRLLEPVLSERVPLEVRRLYEVARGAMLYGYFFYPLYTLGVEQLFRVAEAAAAHKCDELGAGAAAKKNFTRSIEWLVANNAIPKSEKKSWCHTRDLRNAASHPKDQSIIWPPSVLRVLWWMTNSINSLFGTETAVNNSPVVSFPSWDEIMVEARPANDPS